MVLGATSYVMAGKSEGKGYLGVNIERLSNEDKEEFGVTFGVLVAQVVKDGAAEKAGIKKYDVIQYFNDEKMRRPDDLIEAVRANKAGAKVKIKLVRDAKNQEVAVTLGEYKFKDLRIGGKDGKNVIFLSKGGGYLGVHLQELNKDLAGYFGVKEGEGALILKVEKESPAQKAGLKAGDVIVKIGDEKVQAPADARKALAELKKDDRVDVTVIRQKKKQTVKAELGEGHGFHNIQIFKGVGDKFKFKMAPIHIDIPKIEHEFIWNEKCQKELEEKLKKVEKRLEGVGEKVQKKLKHLEEYTTYI
jgi:membrane-associated protease RseP (regulator of RpoE activity)